MGLLTVPAFASPGQEWPRWSGPNRDLSAGGSSLFQRSTFGLEILWSQPLGSAYSGLVIADGRVVTAFSDGTHDVVAAFHAESGEEIWRHPIAETYIGHDGSDDGPLGTPTIDQGRVFVLGPRGQLQALALASGKLLWSEHLEESHGARRPHYGFTTPPTLADGVLVVQTGGTEGHGISGFDPQTGRRLWAVEEATVQYQSPLSISPGGREQVLAATDEFLAGLDPRTGEVHWKLEYGEESMGSSSRPILLGDDRVLLTSRPQAALFQVPARGEDGARTLWKSPRLRGTFALPVPHGDHLYGFAGNILSCVEAATGELVWRSRQPGPGFLIQVDGHLVIQTDAGDLVVAEASPEGYREKARIRSLEQGYYNTPAFADGRIFVRNLDRLVSLGVTETPQSKAEPEPAPEFVARGLLAALTRKLDATDNKKRVVDEFLAQHKSFPILEGDRLVHFVFRGETEDLVLSGNFLAGETPPMHRLEGTDLWVQTAELEPASHYTYYFGVFDEERLDPLNPRKAISGRREHSELTTRGWTRPAHMNGPKTQLGRLETITWTSSLLDSEQEVQIYLPPDHDPSKRYPTLVVNSGNQLLERAGLQGSLDHLIENGQLRPLVAVLVPWMPLDGRAKAYADALAEELLPAVAKEYPLQEGSENRGILGVSGGSAYALYAALSRPDIFGGAALQTLYQGQQATDIQRMIGEGRGRDLKLYLAFAAYEHEVPRRAGRELVDLLRANDYRPAVDEVGDGVGWTSWGSRLDRMLTTLFP